MTVELYYCLVISTGANFLGLGHGKKIHCFSGKSFPTLEAGGQFFYFNLINAVGKSPGNHKQECRRNHKHLIQKYN